MLKKSTTRPICGYCNGCKKNNNYLWDLYVGITMDVKKNNNYLWDLYASITYWKWPYGNYNRKDVIITQCLFCSL
jgi:hypothetical protein